MSENEASVDAPQSPPAPSPAWLPPVAILAGILAGAIGGYTIFTLREFYLTIPDGLPPYSAEWEAQNQWDKMRNLGMGVGTLGALLLGCIGLAVGATVSASRAITGLVAGLISGLVVGIIVGPIGYLTSAALIPVMIEGIVKTIAIYAPIWIAFCLASAFLSLTLRGAQRDWGAAITNGIGLGILGVIIFPLLCTVVFPVGRPELIIPEHSGILYTGYILVGLTAAITALSVLKPKKSKSKTTSEAAS
ncbi:hypothetical protein [Aureliella helgolandensis]|uniref:Uncharacterized protein n=1 Tax=Aureliella helgolandensis TaxID=2527968 RepID=A0A518G9V4_9BACT|nr:hypothetical protein [Aureliella helgolandensis]QDV25375.1 hypothetical protein Q31a_37010 [Aureliella helgolandensis]